ncbi:uncharacterized protein PSFLO_03236 [Pseudozyma flocculosa]|nr:uncharacterized protein PSFLO_03236 [Pseudozyma flocculosa]
MPAPPRPPRKRHLHRQLHPRLAAPPHRTPAHQVRFNTTSKGNGVGGGASQDLSYPSHLASPTPYDIFRLPRSTTSAQVKARYYDLVRCLHPDRILHPDSTASERDKATSEFKLVVQAYNLLKDPRKKDLYDRSGFGWDSKKGLTDAASRGAAGHPWDRTGWANRGGVDRRYRRPAADGWSGSQHDFYGWQTYAASRHGPAFYGFTPSYNPHAARPRYTSNGLFFSTVFVVTWFVAALQYRRISAESKRAIERADRHHLDAAKSLEEARLVARSDEGRQRYEAYKRRAREQKVLEELERQQARLMAGQPLVHGHHNDGQEGHATMTAARDRLQIEAGPWGIGHGGPSGKEAAERRKAEASQREQRRMGRMPPPSPPPADSSPEPANPSTQPQAP